MAFVKKDNRSRKRKAKDEKYGFGGFKRHKKDNSSESASDMSGFSRSKNKALPPGMKQKKTKSKRPGKQARRQGK